MSSSAAPAKGIGIGNSWGAHVRGTLLLGLPLAGAQLAQMSINVADTVLVGRLGTTELAAAVLTTQFFHLVWMLGSGFAIAVMPMAASAAGQGDIVSVRRSVRMGLWVCGLYSAAVMPLMWQTEAIMLALGQDPVVADLCRQYMRVLQWSMFPALAVMVLRSFLSALERPQVVLIVTILGSLFNLLVAYAFIFGRLGAPALGIVGAGVAGLSTMLFMTLLLAIDSARGALAPYEIFVRFWRPDWPGFFDVIRLGWPIGATIVAEVGLFAASSIMIGWIGTVELAAHGIALQLASIAFMVPLGLASAATVRVGLAYGRHDEVGIGRAARTAVLVGAGVALFAALLFVLIPQALVGAYLDRSTPDAAAVLAYAVPLLAVAAGFQFFDTLQALASGILRGLKDTRVPMILAVVSYWLIGMPAAWLLAFPLGLGAVGVWLGLGIGLLAAAASMSVRFLRREKRGQLLLGAP
ncbi:MATE family efflux transporter [Aureimonas populi]|uniref:Multidrug-efflux transporter n=1 Tax=Aureimonas populi TaxID=1701758 RepID=A0ABW5CJD9_9HYPH|nr:MATE family efflux transporter [Aureimonas populi]